MSAAVVGAYGPMLGPGFVPISAQLGITVGGSRIHLLPLLNAETHHR